MPKEDDIISQFEIKESNCLALYLVSLGEKSSENIWLT